MYVNSQLFSKLHSKSESRNDWMEINKGCPQGSLFGPLAFNIFSNDLLLLIQDRCDVYNYANDNSIGIKGKDPNEITDKLSNVSSIMFIVKMV